MTSETRPASPVLLVEVHRTATPAADLPLALIHDVARVLAAHGRAVDGLMLATPVERGGGAPVGGGV